MTEAANLVLAHCFTRKAGGAFVQPSAAGTGMDAGDSAGSAASAAAPELRDNGVGPAITDAPLRAEQDIAAAAMGPRMGDQQPLEAGASSSGKRHAQQARAVQKALSEARMAMEEIVGPLKQPMELLPQAGPVIEVILHGLYAGSGYIGAKCCMTDQPVNDGMGLATLEPTSPSPC
jgi:hypothetical protein